MKSQKKSIVMSKRRIGGFVASAMVLTALMLPTYSAQAFEYITADTGESVGNLVEISNVRVSNVTATSADITFDYKLDSSKMGYYRKNDGKLHRATKADIERVCFVVDVQQIMSITVDAWLPTPGPVWYPGVQVPYICDNATNDADLTQEIQQDIYGIHHNASFTLDGKEVGTATYASFYRTGNIAGKDLADRDSVTISLKYLRPNTFYGNRNIPNSVWGRSDGISGMYDFSDTVGYLDPFYKGKRASTGVPDGILLTLFGLTYQLNGDLSNSGQSFNVDTDVMYVGAQVDYKDGMVDERTGYEFTFPVMYNATHVPNFTTRATDQLVFRDVSVSTPHVDDIRWLADRGISTGWKEAGGSSTFRGMSPVVRQDMAAFLRREARNRGVGDAASWQPSAADWKRFRDVDRNTPHAEDILWFAHASISEGWKEADGTSTFRGMSPVVRQDMAAFLKRLAARAGKDGGVKPKTDFTDVTAATPHMADVQWLGGSGISQGYRNNCVLAICVPHCEQCFSAG